MQVRPLSPAIGAEVDGLDASAPLSLEASAFLLDTLDKYRLLLFRGQEIGADDQIRLVSALAPPMVEREDGRYDSLVTTNPNELVSGDFPIRFHSDYAYSPQGALEVVSLCALVVDQPEPTTFANMVHAASRLPGHLRDRLRTLTALQCQDYAPHASGVLQRVNVGGPDREDGRPALAPDGESMALPHSVIRRHPRTGEEVLNVSLGMTSRFLGVSARESDSLFEDLKPYQYHPSGLYTHHWRRGDLLIWDNIALQHGRAALETSGERTLRRVIGNAKSQQEMFAL